MQVGARLYARAAAYGLGAAILGGFLWAELGGSFRMLLLVGLGYAVGEAVSRGANRKIGTPLSVLAGALTVLSVAIGPALSVLIIGANQLPIGARLAVAVNTGIGVLLGTLFSGLFALLFLALAVVVAVSRVR